MQFLFNESVKMIGELHTEVIGLNYEMNCQMINFFTELQIV